MDAGGAETFLMKIYRTINREKYQMDFCINTYSKCFYEDEIVSLGGKIYRIPEKSNNIIQFRKQLYNIIKDNNYKYVLRITSHAVGFMDLKIAKKAGAIICCARSSNSSDGKGIVTIILHVIGRFLYQKYVDVKIAPSDLAAIYTFGSAEYKSSKVKILQNGLDLSTYKFNAQNRKALREELNIPDNTFVVGHIGRFYEQKNHLFLINVFRQIKEIKHDSKLLLIGDGPLYNQVKEEVERLHIDDSVIFAGVRRDIPQVLSSMDAFVFPSLYEGMPNTVIEAQASGLPCLISDTITREANVNGFVKFMSLNETYQKWAKVTIELPYLDRIKCNQEMKNGQYDINLVTQKFVKFIFEASND